MFTALQVLLLNKIHLFGIASLFLYIYVIIKAPVNLSRSLMVVIAFLLGFVIDMFSNTLGMHTAACTLAGFFRDPLLKVFAERDMPEDITPSSRQLGSGVYFKYVVSVVIIHHAALFLIESLSLYDPLFLTIRIVASVIFTSLIILILEQFSIVMRHGTA
jgi:rod shape-determining protein MreD